VWGKDYFCFRAAFPGIRRRRRSEGDGREEKRNEPKRENGFSIPKRFSDFFLLLLACVLLEFLLLI